eukprot:CAMPEP_0184706736 /NCGR_PEP_ID=MMETSP0313-20130426/36911_1 /TAXON_ID=2792 /ORGANISM="Porphyridium aerugineum, Strain SAG 1380-2" /LENGTH=265 /DNA_ID=CAMNT_0027168297 /DNA_START=226 /DNA_END=1023 /DNA_ORIENTATION=+
MEAEPVKIENTESVPAPAPADATPAPAPSNGAAPPTAQGTSSPQPPVELTAPRVFVGNLSWDTRWQGLKDHMKSAGNVVHAEVFTDQNGRSQGCGVVEFGSMDEAKIAIENLNNSSLDGRSIFVRADRDPTGERHPGSGGGGRGGFRTHRGGGRGGGRGGSGAQGGHNNAGGGGGGGSGQGEAGRKVVVMNLPYSCRWQDLKDIFRTCGVTVVRADIITAQDGRSKGMGTVVFETPDEAQRVIKEMNGVEIDGRQIEIRMDRYAQ